MQSHGHGVFHSGETKTKKSRLGLSLNLALALGGLCLISCQTRLAVPEPPPQFGGLETLKLHQISNRFLNLTWSLHPSIAIEAGIPPTQHQPLACSPQELKAAAKEARHLMARLMSLRLAGLTSQQRQDRKILTGLLKSTLVEIEQLGNWSRDPSCYLDEIEAGMALSRRGLNATAQAERTRIWLLDIPRILTAARHNLKFCPPLFLGKTMDRARELAWAFKHGRNLPPSPQANLQSEIKAAAEKAAEALQQWAIFLETDSSRSNPGRVALGREVLSDILRQRGGIYSPLEFLIGDLKREEIELARDLTKKAGGQPVNKALAGLVAGHSTTITTSNLVEASQFCRQHQLLSEGTITTANGPTRRAPIHTLPGSTNWAEASVFLPRETAAGKTLHVARETLPGLLAIRSSLARNQSPLRRGYTNRVFRLGWLSYAEDLRAEKDNDPKVKLIRAWRLHRECLEVRIALQIHLGRNTITESIEELREKGHLTEEVATDRAIALARDPFCAFGYLGRKVIRQLRFDQEQRSGEGFSLSHFHQQVLNCGAVPMSTLVKAINPKQPDFLSH